MTAPFHALGPQLSTLQGVKHGFFGRKGGVSTGLYESLNIGQGSDDDVQAIRDNRDAAEAMGKDVVQRHRQVFILGSGVVGIAGAMLTTLYGQLTPTSYNPLRFTFLIWVMVIIGGSGNNWGSVLGGFLIWFVWIQAEPVGRWFMDVVTSGMAEDNGLRIHLLDSAAHMRMVLMGAILLLALRFAPSGLIPERTRG